MVFESWDSRPQSTSGHGWSRVQADLLQPAASAFHVGRRQVTLCVFKVTGETNTDDLSPAPDAWSRPDIPLHALAMLKLELSELRTGGKNWREELEREEKTRKGNY